jgi:hypothetical protein
VLVIDEYVHTMYIQFVPGLTVAITLPTVLPPPLERENLMEVRELEERVTRAGISKISSVFIEVPLNRSTVTIVKPPFVAVLKVRGPASRYCSKARSKLTCPWTFGPPSTLYVGSGEDPTAALLRVDTDANLGVDRIRATNLTHAVLEY